MSFRFHIVGLCALFCREKSVLFIERVFAITNDYFQQCIQDVSADYDSLKALAI